MQQIHHQAFTQCLISTTPTLPPSQSDEECLRIGQYNNNTVEQRKSEVMILCGPGDEDDIVDRSRTPTRVDCRLWVEVTKSCVDVVQNDALNTTRSYSAVSAASGSLHSCLVALALRGVYSDTTQLNSTDPVEQRTAKSVVFLFTTSRPTNWVNCCSRCERVDNSTLSWAQLSWVELCRYKRALTDLSLYCWTVRPIDRC